MIEEEFSFTNYDYYQLIWHFAPSTVIIVAFFAIPITELSSLPRIFVFHYAFFIVFTII
jgi:hypothetical protein